MESEKKPLSDARVILSGGGEGGGHAKIRLGRKKIRTGQKEQTGLGRAVFGKGGSRPKTNKNKRLLKGK